MITENSTLIDSKNPQITPLNLDLACGQTPREGFDGVDAYAPNVKYKINLLKFPWPWLDSTVDQIHCSHFIEHIPMEEIDGKDLLFAFFDECYRILKPHGAMTVICPSARSNRAFQDPTHRRFIVAETFLYFNRQWRQENKLDHYKVNCDFSAKVFPFVSPEIQQLDPKKQMELVNHWWNITMDWHASLEAIK